MTVWIPKAIRERGRDFSGLNRFGSSVVIFPKEVNPMNVGQQRRVLREQVLPASFSDDFVLLVGPTLMIATVITEWLNHHGRVRVLAHKQSIGDYEIRTLCLDPRSPSA